MNSKILPPPNAKYDYDFLLKKSKTFCMIPWIHIHSTPTGVAAPCCISKSCSTNDGVGNANLESLESLINSPKMQQLRLDMLAQRPNEECETCYRHDENGIDSARKGINLEFGEYINEIEDNTSESGDILSFKMRYFDLRFNNICNFKCRTCNSSYSSQWQLEDSRAGLSYAQPHIRRQTQQLLNDVNNQIPHIKKAYFAGGESLITDEHYIILEEMIKQGRLDIQLVYNTNLSNIRFKNKDLLHLWSQFHKKVEVSASIDHFGKKAEYIRHGTDWVQVEKNLHEAKRQPFINLSMNTVLSVFNVCSIHEFYEYLLKTGLYLPSDGNYNIYKMVSPEHLTCHVIPPSMLHLAINSVDSIVSLLSTAGFRHNQIEQIETAKKWILTANTWEIQKRKFKEEVTRLDQLRHERFVEIFPEIAVLLDDNT